MNTTPSLFAALDLHSTTTVLGTLSADGLHSRPIRLPTTAEHLLSHVGRLGRAGVRLTLEASPLARWATKLLRTLLSLGHLKEVWIGTERPREILRHLVGEMLESRNKCRRCPCEPPGSSVAFRGLKTGSSQDDLASRYRSPGNARKFPSKEEK